MEIPLTRPTPSEPIPMPVSVDDVIEALAGTLMPLLRPGAPLHSFSPARNAVRVPDPHPYNTLSGAPRV